MWQAIHAAQTTGDGVSAQLPASYESIPLGRRLESMGIMSMEGLGLQLGNVPSYLPPELSVPPTQQHAAVPGPPQVQVRPHCCCRCLTIRRLSPFENI